jgi:hypothetical protein
LLVYRCNLSPVGSDGNVRSGAEGARPCDDNESKIQYGFAVAPVPLNSAIHRFAAAAFLDVIAAQFAAQSTSDHCQPAKGVGSEDRRPATTEIWIEQVPMSHILSKCGEVAERLKAAVC